MKRKTYLALASIVLGTILVLSRRRTTPPTLVDVEAETAE